MGTSRCCSLKSTYLLMLPLSGLVLRWNAESMLDFLLYFIWDYHVRYFDHSINILMLHKATLFSENSFMWVFCLEILKGQKNSVVQTRQNVVQRIGSTKCSAFLEIQHRCCLDILLLIYVCLKSSKLLLHQCLILQKCTTFGESNMHSSNCIVKKKTIDCEWDPKRSFPLHVLLYVCVSRVYLLRLLSFFIKARYFLAFHAKTWMFGTATEYFGMAGE